MKAEKASVYLCFLESDTKASELMHNFYWNTYFQSSEPLLLDSFYGRLEEVWESLRFVATRETFALDFTKQSELSGEFPRGHWHLPAKPIVTSVLTVVLNPRLPAVRLTGSPAVD